ncbi:methyltransferase domain-containing protein [Marinicella litoralis]|uniref:Methyltransferase family protein n=1 Tax=Marinicella litoralis TaxID=644220 RepID=A0A4R6Y0W2_9GAMM|nr:methyltransferase domain-containing protein [Marinicella litoralis]TDR23773.1 methyltransferase family protein [Marinicella litoralis]
MTNNSDLITRLTELIQEIDRAPTSSENPGKLSLTVEKIEAEWPFLYAYLADSFKALKRAIENQVLSRIKKLCGVINSRLSYFGNWDSTHNITIAMINDGRIKPNEIKPFIRFDTKAYEAFYTQQNIKLKEKLKSKVFNDYSDQSYVPIELKSKINHVFRKTYAVNVIETMIGVFNSLGVDKGRWLDVGCGVGYISNAVNQNIYSSKNWEIHGCDLQESRIEFAKKNAAKHKKYTCDDAFSVIKNLNDKGEKTNIVSMFEFCEHFADPADLIQRVSALSVDAVVIGTPLQQKLVSPLDKKPDPVHLWGFTRESMEHIFKTTGLEILLSTENKIGYYGEGLDWLTIIAVTPEIKNKIDASFAPQNK